jgi:hypothetical protein
VDNENILAGSLAREYYDSERLGYLAAAFSEDAVEESRLSVASIEDSTEGDSSVLVTFEISGSLDPGQDSPGEAVLQMSAWISAAESWDPSLDTGFALVPVNQSYDRVSCVLTSSPTAMPTEELPVSIVAAVSVVISGISFSEFDDNAQLEFEMAMVSAIDEEGVSAVTVVEFCAGECNRRRRHLTQDDQIEIRFEVDYDSFSNEDDAFGNLEEAVTLAVTSGALETNLKLQNSWTYGSVSVDEESLEFTNPYATDDVSTDQSASVAVTVLCAVTFFAGTYVAWKADHLHRSCTEKTISDALTEDRWPKLEKVSPWLGSKVKGSVLCMARVLDCCCLSDAASTLEAWAENIAVPSTHGFLILVVLIDLLTDIAFANTLQSDVKSAEYFRLSLLFLAAPMGLSACIVIKTIYTSSQPGSTHPLDINQLSKHPTIYAPLFLATCADMELLSFYPWKYTECTLYKEGMFQEGKTLDKE